MKIASHRPLLALLLAAAGCGGGSTPTLTVAPATLSLYAGGAAASLSANLSGGSGDVTWSLSPGRGALSATSGGTVLYTPPATLSSPVTEVLTASAAGKTAQATITVSPPPIVLSLDPNRSPAVAGGAPVTFTATLSGATGAVSWSLNPPAAGTLSPTTGATATYTPPSQPVLQATQVTVTATAAGATATAPVTLVPSGPVSLPNWAWHSASDWSGSTLSLAVPAGQSAMVLLLNTGDGAVDKASASLTVTGTATLLSQLAPATSALTVAGIDPELALALGHEQVRAAEAGLAPLLAPVKGSLGLGVVSQALTAPDPHPAWCVAAGFPGPGATFSRRSATLAWTTAHALFYVDDANAGELSTADWSALANAWEQRIYPSDTGLFGPPSDVDGNGKLIILFTSQLGGLSSGGAVAAGYYWAGNLFGPDPTAGCNCGAAGAPPCPKSGSLGFTFQGSNGADMFVMNTPTNLATANYTRAAALSQVIPSTLAHEFQHLISFNLHCLVRATTCGTEETWLNEALSKVAEDEAGFGWNVSRAAGAEYLAYAPTSGTSTYLGYDQASLTIWESDPIGNYEGVHAFLRYLADRQGAALLTALSGDPATGNSLKGKENLAFAAGLTFESAVADFTTAAAFSNETFVPDPRFDYTGASWTPFHAALRHLEYQSLNQGTPATATLRADGWNAFATGAAGSGGATIVVQSAATVKPAVLLITFTGTLPKT
ncbi:MAG TPA: hypothetical protein VFE30_16300 [Anaeromyxobacteraceae bacterium]|jgi:hypothetical protein|nr:hypothetical protein [Anaeromyxobacteraceae bacterium]